MLQTLCQLFTRAVHYLCSTSSLGERYVSKIGQWHTTQAENETYLS